MNCSSSNNNNQLWLMELLQSFMCPIQQQRPFWKKKTLKLYITSHKEARKGWDLWAVFIYLKYWELFKKWLRVLKHCSVNWHNYRTLSSILIRILPFKRHPWIIYLYFDINPQDNLKKPSKMISRSCFLKLDSLATVTYLLL